MPTANYPVSDGFATQTSGQRSSSIIRVSGIKMHYLFENTTNFPLVLHHALVQVKEEKDVNDISVLRHGFFRDNTGGESKEKDFLDAPLESDSYQFYQTHFSLNPDVFNILWHKKVTLDPSMRHDTFSNDVNTIEGPRPSKESNGSFILDTYQKINQRVNFNRSGSENVRPFVLVYWVTPRHPGQFSEAAKVGSTGVRARGYDTLYYRG